MVMKKTRCCICNKTTKQTGRMRKVFITGMTSRQRKYYVCSEHNLWIICLKNDKRKLGFRSIGFCKDDCDHLKKIYFGKIENNFENNFDYIKENISYFMRVGAVGDLKIQETCLKIKK